MNRESFKSILPKEAHHALLYTSSSVITQLGSFLLLPLFWRKLSLADYGVIGVSEILCSLFGILWGLSLEVSVSRFYYEWPEEERRQRLGSLWMLSWTSSIALGFLTIWLASIVHPLLFPSVPFFPLILLGMIHGVLVKMRLFTFATIRIKQLPGLYFAYSLTICLISILANVTFLWILDWGLLGYFVAWNVSELIVLVACSILMHQFARPSFALRGVRDAITFALPLIPNSIISSLSLTADRYLLQRFASLEALGIYTACLRFTNIINVVHEGLKMSFAPFLFKAVSEAGLSAAPAIARVRLFYLLPLFGVGLVIAFYLRDLVRLINQPAYFSVAQYGPLLIGPPVIVSLFAYFASGILLSKRSHLLWIPTFAHLIALLVGGLLLIPRWQMNGIIVSRYLSAGIFLAVGAYLSQKYFPIPFNAKRLALLLASFALGITAATLNRTPSLAGSIVLSTVGVLAFLTVHALIIGGPGRILREIRQRLSPGVSS